MVKADGFMDTPKIWARFQSPSGSFESPEQSLKLQAAVTPLAVAQDDKVFQVQLSIDSRQAMGTWEWEIEPITALGSEVGNLSLGLKGSDFEFKRDVFGARKYKSTLAGPAISHERFGGERTTLFPWEGRNVVVLTKAQDLSPDVMGRILFTLDGVYDSYKSMTGFEPKVHRSYDRPYIAVLPPEEVYCGGACGFLGANGIEISQRTFNRLYVGVQRFDQYDQTLLYELGRNFWDYESYQKVLTVDGTGDGITNPFWDVTTTGFACYMRNSIAELNGIPMQPWDRDNQSWQSFLTDTKNLAFIHSASPSSSFASTFQSRKAPYSGPLSVNDFWASVLFYFADNQDLETFNRRFFQSLKNQKIPRMTSEVVSNFVSAISEASGRDVSNDFYEVLRFKDAQGLR